MQHQSPTVVRITNNLTPEQLRQLQGRASFRDALAYMSTWGNSCFVAIDIDQDGDMYAQHFRMLDGKEFDPNIIDLSNMKRYFFLAGIYDAEKDTYSFHS